MIEFIFFKIVVPVAAAMICGLLVWFVIDCLRRRAGRRRTSKCLDFM